MSHTDEAIADVAVAGTVDGEGNAQSRKEKRAQRDAERAAKTKRGKKRKLGDEGDAPALPADNELEEDFIALPKVDATEGAAGAATAAKSKKRKREEPTTGTDAPTVEAGATTEVPKRRRKQTTTDPAPTDAPTDTTTAKPANQRFIVFLGNLPYTTTDASLNLHFKSLQPFTLRHRTDPATKKSKGFAFLEFENYDRMKTCLKLYHHSYFDPENPEKSKLVVEGEPEPEPQAAVYGGKRGRAKKETGRKINVELTVGGGGSGSTVRKEKIKVKNVRLEEQRARRTELGRKERAKKEGKEGGKPKVVEKVPATKGAEGMHPSRMAMMAK
ncbi:hypothetical protein B0A48_17069 [Cryoendolithus antarcticus]|uniref:RRM domain-containing protein n=1 Tax=Cryoendolithus antarcticus TaxID=1507870 RepID=A0A1V8SBF7_9PEZI|nr:hypothetical protein B0A48_17069 [Cryoendolithus antarcticus]